MMQDMPINPTIAGDPAARALYLQFTTAEIAETVELAKGVYLDVDAEGQAVGIEVLNASERLLASLPRTPEAIELSRLFPDRAA